MWWLLAVLEAAMTPQVEVEPEDTGLALRVSLLVGVLLLKHL